MLADDVACSPRNSEPGRVFNDRARVWDLYGDDTEVDFRGEDVTVDNFLRLLTGGYHRSLHSLPTERAGAAFRLAEWMVE